MGSVLNTDAAVVCWKRSDDMNVLSKHVEHF